MSNFSWTGIVNTAKRDISKVVGVVGKDLNAGIKLFIDIEPVAVTAITPFFPEAAVILAGAYKIAQVVETDLSQAKASGATKLATATTIVNTAVIPVLQDGLAAAGKTLDTAAAQAAVTSIFNAIVAENNAQAVVTSIIQAAAASKTLPDAATLAKANTEVSAAVSAVQSAAAAFQTAIKSVQPTPPAATPAQ